MGPAVDVHDLVCHADFRLIRACEGTACTLMFPDRTKATPGAGTAAQVGQDDRLALASDYLLERCRTG
jgi:hypothetical protein